MHSYEKKREAYNKKTLEIERFFFTGIQNLLIGLAARVRSIVGCQFERPDVLLEGLFASGLILLCEVRLLVGRDGGEVVHTCHHCPAYLRETLTQGEFVTADRRRTLVSVIVSDVEARAVRIGGFSFTVSTDEVSTVAVTFLFHGFRERTFHVVNTGCILNFSHNCSALPNSLQPSAFSCQSLRREGNKCE